MRTVLIHELISMKKIITGFLAVFLLFGMSVVQEVFIEGNVYTYAAEKERGEQVVNVYSARKEYLIRPLIKVFEKKYNINVNIVS